MRSRIPLPALLAGLVVGQLAFSASATPLCDVDEGREGRVESRLQSQAARASLERNERLDRPETPLEESIAEASGASLETAVTGAIEELILPCAMVESDLLGPWCVDAAFYLVTTSGTLLCRVSLPAVDITSTSSPDLEDRDPAPAPQRIPLPAPAGGLASALIDAAKPLFTERAPPPDRTRLPPSPVYAEPPFVPG